MPEAWSKRSENLDRNETEPTMCSVMVGPRAMVMFQSQFVGRKQMRSPAGPDEVELNLESALGTRGDRWLSHQRSRGASSLSAFLNAPRG